MKRGLCGIFGRGVSQGKPGNRRSQQATGSEAEGGAQSIRTFSANDFCRTPDQLSSRVEATTLLYTGTEIPTELKTIEYTNALCTTYK